MEDELDRTVIRARQSTVTIARCVGVVLPSGPGLVGSFEGGNDLTLAAISLPS